MNELEAEIHNINGGSKRLKYLYEMGVQTAINSLNSPEFEQIVLNFKFKDPEKGWVGTFHKPVSYYTDRDTGKKKAVKYDNQGIYDLIMSGWDQFHQDADGDMDVDTTIFFKRWSNAYGYTYPGTHKTWINSKFWVGTDEQIIARIAGNVVHEYMHNLGFGHDYNWNPIRDFTVPYGVGNIVYNLALNIAYDPTDIIWKQVCTRIWWTLYIKKECNWIQLP